MITPPVTAPPAVQPRRVRFDPELLYVALDRERRRRHISRRQLLREIGETSPNGLTRLGQGIVPTVDLIARYLHWLGRTDLGPYIVPTDDHLNTEPTNTAPETP